MSQLNTISLRDALLERITDFALDEHFVRDETLSAALRAIWSAPPELGGLGSDLWVEGAFPSEAASETMQSVVDRGIVARGLALQLDRTGAFPLTLTPYRHQLESIESSTRERPGGQRPAIVVTAGTGAGKTESFLIPLLNELWNTPGHPGEGISALILYPMNALVNDQVGRLDRWLDGQGKVTFFHFTSETPENAKVADDRNIRPGTPARFRTRQQARGLEDRDGDVIPNGGGPNPDILVTNYSMLEYMLCRPQDDVFFGENLRVVVLDEAHIYSGNLAAEITLLLRRVLMRCGRTPEEVLCLATSATIGGGIEELRPFAAQLFTKPEGLVEVIAGQPQRPVLEAEPSALPLPRTLAEALCGPAFPEEETLVSGTDGPAFRAASPEVWNQWSTLLAALVPPAEVTRPAEQEAQQVAPRLARALTRSPAIAALQELLWNAGHPERTPLRQLATSLFGEGDEADIEATRRLLQMGATARSQPNVLPLVPNRMHYLMRGPEGILMTFADEIGEAMYDAGGGSRIFSPGADPACLGPGASHPLTLFRCQESGWWGVAGRQSEGKLTSVPMSAVLYGEDDAPDQDAENPAELQPGRTKFYSLTEVPGRPVIHFNPATGHYGGVGPVRLWEVEACPISGTPLSPNKVGWFAARARLQLSVLAETALAEMPPYPEENRVWKPARGRRLLVFSDSRAEAARLGPRLTRQHELQVFRAAVIERLQNVNLAGTPAELDELRAEIEQMRAELQNATPARQQVLQRRIDQAHEDLRQMEEGGTVADWANVLRESDIIAEMHDAQLGKDHRPGAANVADAWIANSTAIYQSLPSLLGRELARRPAWPHPSLETLGLIEITYPGLRNAAAPMEILGLLPPASASALERLWPDYLASLLDAVRNQGAVTLGSEEEDRDYQYGNGFLGKKFAAEHGYRRSMIPLIGVEVEGESASRRNAFTRNVLVALGVPQTQAIEFTRKLMPAAFEALFQAAQDGRFPWLEATANAPTDAEVPVGALRIRFRNLGFRRPSDLFQCEATGQVWPRSVQGFFPGGPNATLRQVSHDEIDMDPRLGRRRRELRDWHGFKLGLWAEEHSAQLSPEENARLQDLFREGMRNILSSTTTLELGIDIGGLSAVLLGNLPPGKANYLQRAGRAGRRTDGTSAVLGFARPTVYEREVFLDFRRYLNRELRRPTIFLDRAPIVQRHAHAWLLGEFFRRHSVGPHAAGAMEVYGKMGPFTGRPLPAKWDHGQPKPVLGPISNNPVAEQFLRFLSTVQEAAEPSMVRALRRLWEGCPNVNSGDADWPANLTRIHGDFSIAFEEWSRLASELENTWREIPEVPGPGVNVGFLRAQANAVFYQLRALRQLTVIEALADSRVLPRYGFPIGLSRLRVQVPDGRFRSREEDTFRLQRDSMMAMREYTPGSQLLAGGRVITSRGLLKHWTGEVAVNESWGLRGRFVRTGNGYFAYNLNGAEPQVPPALARGLNTSRGVFLFPKHGFTTAAWDPPRFGSDFERVGTLQTYTLAFDDPERCDSPQPMFGGLTGCLATYRNAGELLLLNSGEDERGFAICQKCGYAESEWRSGGNGRVDLPRRFEWHAPLNAVNGGIRCWAEDEAPVWRNHHLAAKQSTHLLKLDFQAMGRVLSGELLYTLGQAFRMSAAHALEIDDREIGALEPTPDPQSGEFHSVILYDSLAGGSGHLAQLSHPENHALTREWINSTIALLTVEGEMPEPVRQREALRRLLTSGCDDTKLIPDEALRLLQDAVNGVVRIPPQPVAQLPEGVWTIDMLQHELPTTDFSLFCGGNEIIGLPEGIHDCEVFDRAPSNAFPEANAIVLVRMLDQRVAFGMWLHTATTDPVRPHRVRLRRRTEPVTLELTEQEFQRLHIVAVLARA